MTTKNLWEHGPALAAQWPIWGLLCDARNRSALSIEELALKTGVPSADLDDFEHARKLPAAMQIDHPGRLFGRPR